MDGVEGGTNQLRNVCLLRYPYPDLKDWSLEGIEPLLPYVYVQGLLAYYLTFDTYTLEEK